MLASLQDLTRLLFDLGEILTADEAREWMQRIDPDRDGSIERTEFVEAILNYVYERTTLDMQPGVGLSHVQVAPAAEEGDGVGVGDGDGDGEEGEEEVEVPDDLKTLPWQEQQTAIKKRAAYLMAVGTLLIVVFSDPAVDVMSNVGTRLGLAPFYVAFVLAPLASNASEFIASYSYAAKKTQKTITVSLAALEGAACMNNTFCLAIFMALIFFQKLAWKFSVSDGYTTVTAVCSRRLRKRAWKFSGRLRPTLSSQHTDRYLYLYRPLPRRYRRRRSQSSWCSSSSLVSRCSPRRSSGWPIPSSRSSPSQLSSSPSSRRPDWIEAQSNEDPPTIPRTPHLPFADLEAAVPLPRSGPSTSNFRFHRQRVDAY